MVDTVRTIPYLLSSEFQDGQVQGSISPQDIRDFIVTMQALTNPVVAANIQTVTPYTFQLTDSGLIVAMKLSGANSIRVDSATGFPTGTILQGVQYGTGQTTISGINSAVVVTTSSFTTRAQYSSFTLWKIETGIWILSGDLT